MSSRRALAFFSNIVEQNTWNHTRRERRQLHFPVSSHPPASTVLTKRELPDRKSSLCQERNRRVSNQLTQPFGTLHKSPALVSPYPDQHSWDRRRQVGRQALPIAARQQEQSQFTGGGGGGPDPQTNPAEFATEETNGQLRCNRTPADFTSFHPTGILIWWCQPPESLCPTPCPLPYPSQRLEPHQQPVQASTAARAQDTSTNPHSWPPLPCAHSKLATLCTCTQWPDNCSWPQLQCAYPGRDCGATGG